MIDDLIIDLFIGDRSIGTTFEHCSIDRSIVIGRLTAFALFCRSMRRAEDSRELFGLREECAEFDSGAVDLRVEQSRQPEDRFVGFL